MRHLIARDDAHNCLHFWTLQNEYESYRAWQEHQRQVRLVELRTIAQEVSGRAAIPDDEAAALISEARAVQCVRS